MLPSVAPAALPAGPSQAESDHQPGTATSSANSEVSPREPRRMRPGATEDEILGVD
jgi:hypothetical protein